MDKSSIHYKILHFKNIPLSLRKTLLILINWTFQSILYMDKTEKIFKISFTFIFSILFFAILQNYYSSIFSIVSSFLIAHTLNWLFNGQIFVLLKNLSFTKNEPDVFIEYLSNLRIRCLKEKSILAAAAFGSLSRDELKKTSDLDVRLIRKKGVINGFKACLFILIERSRAFFNKFPLDIYLLDDTKDLSKLNNNERAIVLHDPVNVLKKYYQGEVIIWKL